MFIFLNSKIERTTTNNKTFESQEVSRATKTVRKRGIESKYLRRQYAPSKCSNSNGKCYFRQFALVKAVRYTLRHCAPVPPPQRTTSILSFIRSSHQHQWQINEISFFIVCAPVQRYSQFVQLPAHTFSLIRMSRYTHSILIVWHDFRYSLLAADGSWIIAVALFFPFVLCGTQTNGLCGECAHNLWSRFVQRRDAIIDYIQIREMKIHIFLHTIAYGGVSCVRQNRRRHEQRVCVWLEE